MSNKNDDVTQQLLEQNAELIRLLKEKEDQKVVTPPPYKPRYEPTITPKKNSFESLMDFIVWTFWFIVIFLAVFYVFIMYM